MNDVSRQSASPHFDGAIWYSVICVMYPSAGVSYERGREGERGRGEGGEVKGGGRGREWERGEGDYARKTATTGTQAEG